MFKSTTSEYEKYDNRNQLLYSPENNEQRYAAARKELTATLSTGKYVDSKAKHFSNMKRTDHQRNGFTT